MGGTHEFIEDERNQDILIYANGDLVHRDHANVSVFHSAFLAGDALRESFRLYNGKIAFSQQHLDRLVANAKGLDPNIGMAPEADLLDIVVGIPGNALCRQGEIPVQWL